MKFFYGAAACVLLLMAGCTVKTVGTPEEGPRSSHPAPVSGSPVACPGISGTHVLCFPASVNAINAMISLGTTGWGCLSHGGPADIYGNVVKDTRQCTNDMGQPIVNGSTASSISIGYNTIKPPMDSPIVDIDINANIGSRATDARQAVDTGVVPLAQTGVTTALQAFFPGDLAEQADIQTAYHQIAQECATHDPTAKGGVAALPAVGSRRGYFIQCGMSTVTDKAGVTVVTDSWTVFVDAQHL